MEAGTRELEQAFGAWREALATGDLDTFWDLMREDCEILDEDYPWRLTKEEFRDHIGFHLAGGGQGLWEFFEWVPRELHLRVVGDCGHVSGFSTFRGKPRDAGFRQRFMGFTQTWVREAGRWRMLCWHQSVLAGRIEGASPS